MRRGGLAGRQSFAHSAGPSSSPLLVLPLLLTSIRTVSETVSCSGAATAGATGSCGTAVSRAAVPAPSSVRRWALASARREARNAPCPGRSWGCSRRGLHTGVGAWPPRAAGWKLVHELPVAVPALSFRPRAFMP